jgi:hypothetical protein
MPIHFLFRVTLLIASFIQAQVEVDKIDSKKQAISNEVTLVRSLFRKRN